MLIQVILIIIIVLIVVRSYFQAKHNKISWQEFSLWLVIWLVAALIVIYPRLTSVLADFVGVGRGADLVIYISVVMLFYLIFRLLMRIENMEKDITKLVRELSFKNNNDKHEND